MQFDALEVSLKAIHCLRLGKAYARILGQDPDLARQLRKSLSSVPLNLSEGFRRRGKDRKFHWRVAAGSAEEARTCLRVACAWGYVKDTELAEMLQLIDRVVAMLWLMTR